MVATELKGYCGRLPVSQPIPLRRIVAKHGKFMVVPPRANGEGLKPKSRREKPTNRYLLRQN